MSDVFIVSPECGDEPPPCNTLHVSGANNLYHPGANVVTVFTLYSYDRFHRPLYHDGKQSHIHAPIINDSHFNPLPADRDNSRF